MNKANKTIFYKGEKISNNSVKKEWKAFREKSFAEIIIYFGEKIKFQGRKICISDSLLKRGEKLI